MARHAERYEPAKGDRFRGVATGRKFELVGFDDSSPRNAYLLITEGERAGQVRKENATFLPPHSALYYERIPTPAKVESLKRRKSSDSAGRLFRLIGMMLFELSLAMHAEADKLNAPFLAWIPSDKD